MNDDDNTGEGTWSSQARALWDADGLTLLLENSADIIVVLDQNGLIRFANPSGQELLGHATE
jgi:PAS domain-containing protein